MSADVDPDVAALAERIRARRVAAGRTPNVESPELHRLYGAVIASSVERREASPQGDAAA